MFAMEDSLILLVDNRELRMESTCVRLLEKLKNSRPRCYNGLRLAQLAAFGYKFGVLVRFAVSTQTSRSVVEMGEVRKLDPPPVDAMVVYV
jgi:hypothetical protein